MTAIAVSALAVEFGATTIFSNITFTIGAGDKWGIVGRNGTGKTTLFRVLTKEIQPTQGNVALQPEVRFSLLEQHRDFGDAVTVWEAAAGELAELLSLEQSLIEQSEALATDSSEQALKRYSRDLERFEHEGGYAVTSRIDAVLHGLGFDPAAARVTPVKVLSGGERGRLGLARQLIGNATVLLLDEPTNHLDLDTTRWLEQHLKESDKTIIAVSHDRAFLAAVTDHILHFEGDSAFPYYGGYQAFVAQRNERRRSQQRAFDKEQRVIARETDYIARNIAGQNTKQAKGRRKRLERMPRLSAPIQDAGSMSLRFEIHERGGDIVVAAKNASIAVNPSFPRTGESAPSFPRMRESSVDSPESDLQGSDGPKARILVEKLNVTARRGDIVGLIGPNGSGKTTLLRTLMGERPVTSGELKLGGSISAAYFRQDLAQVPLDKTMYEAIETLRPHWERRLIQGHLGRFGFSGDEVQRRTNTLSGGERSRIALAMMMLTRANLLVLDEPTNHLDLESIEALEDAIEDYEGTVLLVSHDRELLRALTTRVWILHEKHISEFDGSFAEWEEVSAERAHAAAVRAAEEEALRKVHERKKVAAQKKSATAQSETATAETGGSKRNRLRKAQSELAAAEARVAELESLISTITSALEDPALYLREDGAAEARELGVRLEAGRRELDATLESWTRLSEEVQKSEE